MLQLNDYLLRHAAETPEKDALICKDDRIGYAEFYRHVKEESLRWKEAEVDAIVVKASQSIDFLVTYFALHLAGKAIVPLESDMPAPGVENIRECVEKTVIPADISDILFTTGTTGRQKGVMISHRAIIANGENLIDSQGYTDETVFVISGPLNHIGNLSKVWPVIIKGGTIIITEGMRNINSFFAAFNYPSSKFATFLVPANIRILAQYGEDKFREIAEKLDFIETGAAPMSQSDMLNLRSLLPHTRLYNTYASTETGIITTYDFSKNECIAGCLGAAMKHATVFITEDGRVACKGDMLMSGYIGDELLTQSVLREGVVYTSDSGFLDSDGYLNLQGRIDDVINVGGYKISPVEVENMVLSFPQIKDCICISAPHPITGSILKLLYVTECETFSQKSLIKYLKEHLESHKVPFLYEKTDKIERTYNGKLNRNYYKRCD